jgi:hypothetical protein
MGRFARLPIQFLKIGKTDATDIQLPEGGLSDRETGHTQVIDIVAAASQKSGMLQIREKSVHGAYRQTGTFCYLFCSQARRRSAEQLKKRESALQSSDVISSP